MKATRLWNKLFEQGYVKKHLRSSLRMFNGRYGDLIKQYEFPLSRMLNDILWPVHIQWQPSTDQTLYKALTLLPNSIFYRILWGFHYRTFARGVACRQVTLTPPDTSSRPFGTCISTVACRKVPSALFMFSRKSSLKVWTVVKNQVFKIELSLFAQMYFTSIFIIYCRVNK